MPINAAAIQETHVYKIVPAILWADATRSGTFTGSDHDRRDGFIHLSAGAQVRETLAKHFKDQTDLLLVAYNAKALGSALHWEASRDGELFPHLYGSLQTALALWHRPLPEPVNGARLWNEAWLEC